MEAVYSTASAESVAEFVARRYPLPQPLECALLQRGFNDSFEVKDAKGHRYILRMSCRRARGEADVASETAFLRYLEGAGVPVAAAVPTVHGEFFTHVEMPEGRRETVLFRYIEGRAVEWESFVDAALQGDSLAKMHNAADQYPDRENCRYRLNLDHLLHRPLERVLAVRGLSADSQKTLSGISSRLSAAVSAIPDLTWTRCHGDCHGANARVPAAGEFAGKAVLFDFDDGGSGYLAYDLAVNLWARTSFGRTMHAQWHSFVKAYNAVRPVTAADLEATQLFVAIRHIWFLGEYAGRASEWAAPTEWFQKEVQFLEAWEDEKLAPDLFDFRS